MNPAAAFQLSRMHAALKRAAASSTAAAVMRLHREGQCSSSHLRRRHRRTPPSAARVGRHRSSQPGSDVVRRRCRGTRHSGRRSRYTRTGSFVKTNPSLPVRSRLILGHPSMASLSRRSSDWLQNPRFAATRQNASEVGGPVCEVAHISPQDELPFFGQRPAFFGQPMG